MNDNISVKRWLSKFDNNPVDAINNLFMGKVFLGAFAQDDPPEALLQIITDEEIPALDKAIAKWLESVLGLSLNKFNDKHRFANALTDAFRSIILLSLPISRDWCIENKFLLLPWLEDYNFGAYLNPAEILKMAILENTKR